MGSNKSLIEYENTVQDMVKRALIDGRSQMSVDWSDQAYYQADVEIMDPDGFDWDGWAKERVMAVSTGPPPTDRKPTVKWVNRVPSDYQVNLDPEREASPSKRQSPTMPVLDLDPQREISLEDD